MINISRVDDLEFFTNNYKNELIKNTVVELFNCIYSQSEENELDFNLENIIDGNGSIMICENDIDKNILLKVINNVCNKLSWCIKFKVVHNIEQEFFQLGIIINKNHCEQYIIPSKLFDYGSSKIINRLVSCIRVVR